MGIIGRKAVLKLGEALTPFAAVRTKTMTFNKEIPDVTSDGDLGIRRHLLEPGELTVEFQLEGIFRTEDDELLSIAMTDNIKEYAAIDTGEIFIAGYFVISNFAVTQSYKDACGFSCTLESTGGINQLSIVIYGTDSVTYGGSEVLYG